MTHDCDSLLHLSARKYEHLPGKEREAVERAFFHYDADLSGYLETDEIVPALRETRLFLRAVGSVALYLNRLGHLFGDSCSCKALHRVHRDPIDVRVFVDWLLKVPLIAITIIVVGSDSEASIEVIGGLQT